MKRYISITLLCLALTPGTAPGQTSTAPRDPESRTPLFELPSLGGTPGESPPEPAIEEPLAPAPSTSPDALAMPGLTPTTPEPKPDLRLRLVGRGEVRSGVVVFAQPGEGLVFETLPASEETGQQPESAPDTTRFEALGSGAARYILRSVREWTVESSSGAVGASASGMLAWVAPETPGWQSLQFQVESYATAIDSQGAEGMIAKPPEPARASLPIAVLYPMDSVDRGVLEGYPIGLYPSEQDISANDYVSRFRKYYKRPEWLVKVTPETENIPVGEHFRLGDFSPMSERGHVHFIVLDPNLIRFLDALHEQVAERFGPQAKLEMLRAYLSPAERKRLERQNVRYTTFARYQYGDAAAIVVSTGQTRGLADLDRNGAVDTADAEMLAAMVERLQVELDLPGGVGVVKEPVEPDWPPSPFVLVDLRGIQTRW